MKKHVKGIMKSKGFAFIGSVLGGTIKGIPRSSKFVPGAKYMVFKKIGTPKYVFIHVSKATGVHALSTSPSRIYKRPIRGGGSISKFGLISKYLKSPHGLYSIV